MALVVARREVGVVREPALGFGEDLRRDDRRHGHRDPVGLGPAAAARFAVLAIGALRRVLRLHVLMPVIEKGARVGALAQDAVDGGLAPVIRPARRRDTLIGEPLGDAAARETFLCAPAEDVTYHRRLGFVLPQRGAVLAFARHVSVAVGRVAAHQPAASGPVHLPPTRALADLGPLVLSEGPLHRQQQFALWGVRRLTLKELHRDAGFFPLLQQEDLMGGLADQPVGRQNQQSLECASVRRIAQAVEGWALQGGPRVRLVDELLDDAVPTLLGVRPDGFELTLYRCLLFLATRTHPGIDGGPLPAWAPVALVTSTHRPTADPQRSRGMAPWTVAALPW